MDEFSIAGPTEVAEVKGGEVSLFTVLPEAFGLTLASDASLTGGDAEANASILRLIFAGERGAMRDVVVMNAAAVLVVAGLAGNFPEGARLAEATIDAGKVTALVSALAGHTLP